MYKRQLSSIEQLEVPVETSRRFDCVFCGGPNTLAVTNDRGELKWYCFRASCKASGSTTKRLEVEDAKRILNLSDIHDGPNEFTLPNHWTSCSSSRACISYLTSYEIQQSASIYRCFYDPKLNRCVFGIIRNDNLVGAIGRSLSGSGNPRWFKYGKNRYPFTLGKFPRGVLVEDVPSAIKAYRAGLTGIALCGTKLLPEHIQTLKELGLSSLVIALDQDATSLSFQMERVVSYTLPTTIKILDKDLKNMKIPEIQELME